MLTTLFCAAAAAITVHLAPDGDDAAQGTVERPVKTLQCAVERVRAVERDAPKEIVVRDGFYPFEKAVCLNANDCDLTIRAEHPGKAVFSGGARLTKWRKDEEDDRFLVTDLPFDVTPGAQLTFMSSGVWRDLSIFPTNGVRIGVVGGKSDQTAITFDRKSVPGGIDIGAFDYTSGWLVVPQEWSNTACYVKDYDAEHGTFLLANKTAMSFKQFNQGFYMRNVRFGLSQPGQWMFELAKKRIVYYPAEGETADNLVVHLSRAGSLLFLGKTQNVTIDGIVFESVARVGGKKNPYALAPHDAAISGLVAKNTLIDRCEVWNCAADGISFNRPCDIVVRRTHVHHVGGMGIYFCEQGSGTAVEQCEIDHGGMMTPTALVYSYSNTRVIGCKIHDGPACGATLWATGTVVASNEFYRLMLNSKDGGCLYGAYMHSEFHDNFVHDTGGWPGLYADEGSRYCRFYNNRFVNSSWPIHMHCTQNIIVSNNVFQADFGMWYSFQGSGHGTFCDNKIYVPEAFTDDGNRGACDFWGRNEIFVKQADGSYKSNGPLTLERVKTQPGTLRATNVSEQPRLPLTAKGEADYALFNSAVAFVGTGADGCANMGVPTAGVRAAYDANYLYLGVNRLWNALRAYTGEKNFTSRGWGHCDATRFDFEGGKWVIYHPDGSFEASSHFTDGKVKIQQDDVKGWGTADCILRLPLAALDVKGAKAGFHKLDLDDEESAADDMLTPEAAEVERGPERKLPPAKDVAGLKIGFNATIWIEDFRETKSLYPYDGENRATGTLEFSPLPKKK